MHRLEELSTATLDAVDRTRALAILTVSPLEEHGPRRPLGVDAFTARHFAERLAERLVAARPGFTVVLTPTLHLGSFTFEAPGTVSVRQRVVRDVVIDYGASLARAGFRYIVIANGHAGPGHLVALDERDALREDAHGGWWETSLMLRPDLIDAGFRELAPARYPLISRLRPNYPLRDGGLGYVGYPALADPAFAKATTDVLMAESLRIVQDLLDGRLRRADRRSPFFVIPVFRTNFWRTVSAVGTAAVAATVAWTVAATRGSRTVGGGSRARGLRAVGAGARAPRLPPRGPR